MLLSFHPIIEGDHNIWALAPIDNALIDLIRQASAIVLPQTVTRELYRLCRENCPKVFPNYDLRFSWEGKVGDTFLFWSNDIAHPKSIVFPNLESLIGEHPEMMDKSSHVDFPYVIKGAKGGEGRQVRLVKSEDDLENLIPTLKQWELAGNVGLVMQEYLAGLQRDLRIVVIGEEIRSYWRCNDSFLHNVRQGGEIDRDSDIHLQKRGQEAVRDLCLKTGINLAGFDLVFPDEGTTPLFLEINYTFGRNGLGGSEAFYSQLNRAVQNWLEK